MVSASPACTPQATLAEVMYWRRLSSVPAPSPRSALRSITAAETLEIALGRLDAGAQSVLPVRRGQMSLRLPEPRPGGDEAPPVLDAGVPLGPRGARALRP